MSFGAVYYLIRDQVICTLTKYKPNKALTINLISLKVKRRNLPVDNAEYGALYGIYSLSFIISLISFSYNCFYKLHFLQNFSYS